MATNGLVVMTPTSIASTGTGNSSSINADGSVDFASCATLSLNGVFTSDYDNYMIVMRINSSSGVVNISARLRANGTDASGADYVVQNITADGTSVTGARTSSLTSFGIADAYTTQRAGSTCYLYGPYLAQPTAMRHVGAQDYVSAAIVDRASTHSLSTSYDGITVIPASSNITGLVTVFGFNQ